MKRAFVLAAALVVCLAAGGVGLEDLEVRTDRPRIWFTPERLEALRGKFETDPIAINEHDAGARALRYVLTGNAEDARYAIDYILDFDVSEEVLREAPASDEYRWEAMVPVIYDWCHDEMTGEQRRRFRERYGHIAMMMNRKPWGGPTMPGNNYYSGYMRNSGIFGLAAYGESPLARLLLKDALVTRWRESSLPHYARGARGGTTGEGSQYGRYNIGYVTWLAEAAKTASNRSLYRETNWFREFVYYTIYSTTPSPMYARGVDDTYFQRFPKGDDQFSQGYPRVCSVIGDSMRALALEFADERVGGHAKAYLDRVEPPKGLFGWVVEDDRRVDPLHLERLPYDYFAPGAGVAYLRSDWSPGATAIMLQLGTPTKTAHLHQDLGSFQILRGGSWLSKESTGYNHQFKGTRASEARAHNVLLFDGRGQANAHADGPPKLRAMQSEEMFFHAVVGMTAAYRAQESPRLERDDNPSAGMVVRQFLFIRPDLLIIFDRMKSTAPEVEKTFVLHLPERPEETDQNTFIYSTAGSRLVAQFVYPQDLRFDLVDGGDIEGEITEPGRYQWRVEATQSGSIEGHFLTVLTAQERFDMEPVVDLSETDETVDIVIHQPGRRVELSFNKVLSDNFGHMLIRAAGAHGHLDMDLREAVQPISVDADGVHWGKFEVLW